jgi:circadian clock protein KaiB
MTTEAGPPAEADDRSTAGRELRYDLALLVSGASKFSGRAIADVTRLCDTSLRGHYHLSVIDVHDDPAGAVRAGVIAAPTLLKRWPLPARRRVGDLSDAATVLRALDIESPETR